MLLAAGCLLLLAACGSDDKSYLVRETDSIRFTSALASSKQITLRCQGSWKAVIPEDARWISTTPAEGVSSGEFEWITVSATHNRTGERTATIFLENGGQQYPITVTQADGAVVYGVPYVEGNLIEQEPSRARLNFTYANAYGDETIAVSCSLSGDAEGLAVAGASVELVNGSATVALDITGTPATPGYAVFTVSVDGAEIGSARAKVYSMSEMPIEGLPVKWEFCPVKGSTEDVNALKAKQPGWITSSHSLVSEDGKSYLTVVEAAGKTASAVNGWAYNDGHAYLKGLYVDDYWLQKIPVKYLTAGTMINTTGSIGGSGSAAGFFLVEYSADGQTWHRADGAKTETFNNTEVTYHVRAYDSPLFEGANTGYFSCDFPVGVSIASGTLWVRYRVSANVRITVNNTITTGGGGSSRLKGTFSVSVVE
jgi:hypothetical protein